MLETKIIPIELLVEPPNRMRFEIDEEELEKLVQSIRAIGLREPLNVRPEFVAGEIEAGDAPGESKQGEPKLTGRFVIDAGHRRYLACKRAGLKFIKCEVETDLSIASDSVMIAENTIRHDATPVEEGAKYCEIANTPGMTEERLQEIIGRPLSYIYSRMDLLRGDEKITQAVHRGDVSVAVAKELNKISAEFWRRKGHEATPDEWAKLEAEAKSWREYYLQLAIDAGTTARQTAMWVRQWESTQGLRPPQPEPQVIVPQVTVQPYQLICALCGQHERPFDLETIMVCRSEWYAIRAAFKQEQDGGQS